MARLGYRPVRRRRRLNWPRLLTIMALLAALIGLYQLERSPLLRLQHIQVVGGSSALGRLSGLRLDEPLWSIDQRAAERHLLARAPYLRTAVVERQWPQSVRIVVTRRHPIAAVGGPGGTLWGVDAQGRVLTQLGHPAGMTVLGGVPAADVGRYRDLRGTQLHLALALVAAFARQDFRVSQVVASSPLIVYLPSGTEVLWPPGTNVAGTLRELQTILQALSGRGAVASSIDLRVAARPLVVLRR